ncbi:hypothetical protein [Microcoleus sp. T2B6]|uniref:hypothetical protein n=2 Tax=unclassified Microcoleus TaxID=2642155 RepID=UPI002FD1F78B
MQPSARNWSFEAGGRRQEAEGKRKKERGRRKEPEEGRSQKKYFYKYEMLPLLFFQVFNFYSRNFYFFNIWDFPRIYQSKFKRLLQTNNKFIIKQTRKPDRSIIAKSSMIDSWE